ncbi:MAG TPA: outer membrane lipoprotein carrier protein LolA [Caulobacteraceae bacterium]
MKARLLALTAAAIFAGTAPTLPATAQSRAPASDKAAVDQASSYLQGLNGARGRFVQTDHRGQVTRGTYYLQRPGKLRLEYDAPSRLLIVADGSKINVSDPRLKTFNSYPQGSTPLSLFLGRSIDIDRGAVTSVTRSSSGFAINARDRKNPRLGYITLSFSGSPVQLREWTVVDGKGQRTRVQLTSMTRASGFAPSLFRLSAPARQARR